MELAFSHNICEKLSISELRGRVSTGTTTKFLFDTYIWRQMNIAISFIKTQLVHLVQRQNEFQLRMLLISRVPRLTGSFMKLNKCSRTSVTVYV
jgi:hypothetical protein